MCSEKGVFELKSLSVKEIRKNKRKMLMEEMLLSGNTYKTNLGISKTNVFDGKTLQNLMHAYVGLLFIIFLSFLSN